MATSRHWLIVRWITVGVGAALAVLAIVAATGSRTTALRRLVIETLGDRLDSEVELQVFSVDTFPSVDIRGEGLVVRLRGHDHADMPPLIKVQRFSIQGGVLGLVARPRRFRTIVLEGLEINIPPGGPDFDQHYGRAANADAPDQPSSSPIRIDRLHSTDALLRLIPRRAGKKPREFLIHALEMSGIGIDQRMPFQAALTNPLPRGLIKTSGRFGPWGRDDPGATPVDGTFTFDNVDLSTIDGIGGTLTSHGEFRGLLGRINVKGETKTPDFRLDIADHSLPLSTRFEAIVDGTNGDTHLKTVDARLRQTPILASGAITDVPGVKGRNIKLQVEIANGRIEDVLYLAVKSPEPVMTGRLAMQTDFLLPTGRGKVVDKLRLDGTFDLSSAQFSDADVRGKLAAMSARAKGDPEEVAGRLKTNLGGRFRLADGVVTMSDLRFQIPGAAVRLAGTYGLRSEAINFDGTLRMDATISEAAGGGAKSVFLKIVDPLFRRKGAGAELPIKVRGTRENPKFGLDVGRVFTPK